MTTATSTRVARVARVAVELLAVAMRVTALSLVMSVVFRVAYEMVR